MASTIDQTPATEVAAGGITRRRWVALGVLCLAELLVVTDNTIVNVALPTISRTLDAGTSGLQWVVDAYTLAFAGLLLAGGYFGDRYGRRLALNLGLVGFAALSAVAASSSSLTGLVASRVFLGAFAALVFPATLAIIVVMFPSLRDRAIAVGVWAATAGVSAAVGPVLGGYLLEHFSWGSIFWVNVPAAAVLLVLIAAFVPDGGRSAAKRFDLSGVLLSVIGVSTLVYTVIEGPHRGWLSVWTLGGFALALVVLVVFVVRELGTDHPILDVRLFANRPFAVASTVIASAFFCLFGFIFLITQYMQAVKGYDTLQAGVRTLPFAAVMAFFSPVAVVAMAKFGASRVAAVGAVIMSGGFALALLVDRDSSYWGLIVWSMALVAAGLGLIQGPATTVIMSALTPEQAGAGSAVNDTTREVGGALGVAVQGSVLSSVYASNLTDALRGRGLPAAAESAARESVMSGVAVARRTPGPNAEQLLRTVQDAFVHGLRHSALVAVVLAAVVAPMAWLWMGRYRFIVGLEPAGEQASAGASPSVGEPAVSDAG